MRMLYEFDYNEDTYEADLDVQPSTRDVPYMRNGDPGYPGDPVEIELVRLWKLTDGREEITDENKLEWFQAHIYEYFAAEIDQLAKDEGWEKEGDPVKE